jgi:hypothetical protein
MGISLLRLPTDTPWERICVSEDILDSRICDEHLPSKKRTSIAFSNLWLELISFNSSSASFANGGGLLVFPGEEKYCPMEDGVIEGPITTIHMANFRSGAQDHLCLTMAKILGLKTLVDEEVLNIVSQDLFQHDLQLRRFCGHRK